MPEPATSDPTGRVAVLPVRDGVLPSGALDTVRAAGGDVIVVGDGGRSAALELVGAIGTVRAWETPGFAPAAWSVALAPLLERYRTVVLPSSPDGRDLAPRLAALLHRPLHAGAVEVTPPRIQLSRNGSRELHVIAPGPEFVATLLPGVRGVAVDSRLPAPTVHTATVAGATSPHGERDVTVVGVQPPDPATVDLAEAPRIVGGGAGLDTRDRIDQLQRISTSLGASMGATRVVTDRGWVPHARQIGTTGVVVDPQLYLAFGVSGAVQHTSGLGNPDHIISVNTDQHCPMMQLADLAIVSDANATLDALEALLQREPGAIT